jgi:hypothetical protein
MVQYHPDGEKEAQPGKGGKVWFGNDLNIINRDVIHGAILNAAG